MKKKLRVMSIYGHTFCADFINSHSIVVDLGAHVGGFSSQICDYLKCKSYAIEASPSLYTKIPENSLLTKYNYAIAETNGHVALKLAKNAEANTTGDLADDMQQGSVFINGITFETFLAAQKIEIIDLLKVDIEGAELSLFKSTADDTICKINQITIEFHDFIPELSCVNEVEDIKKRLRKLGFFCAVFSKSYNTDVLFIKNSVISNLEYQYLRYFVRYQKGGLRFLKRILRLRNTKAQEFV